MDIDGLADISWREALIALVALLAVYVIVVFLRLRRLKPAEPLPEVALPSVATAAVSTYSSIQQGEPPGDAPEEAPAPPFPWEDAPAAPEKKPALPVLEVLEQEVDQLRREVGSLRAEILLLREAQKQAAAKPPVRQTISPLYNEAMQLALQGNDAADISRHCSISRAEAELVVSLVKNQGDS